jgi:hypothetical protein
VALLAAAASIFGVSAAFAAHPSRLRVTSGASQVRLHWSGSGAAWYEIWRASPSTWAPIAAVPAWQRSYVDRGVSTGVRYRYRLGSVDRRGRLLAVSNTAIGIPTVLRTRAGSPATGVPTVLRTSAGPPLPSNPFGGVFSLPGTLIGAVSPATGSPAPVSTATPPPTGSPAPVSTATPPPTVTGTVLWKADASQPVYDEWAEISTPSFCPPAQTSPQSVADQSAGRETTVVPTGHAAAYGFTVSSLLCAGDNRRSELGEANPPKPGFDNRLFQPGDDRWISFQILLGSDFPLAPKTTDGSDPWQVIAQFKQLGAGIPVLTMHVEGGKIGLYKSNTDNVSTATRDVPQIDANGVAARVPVVANRWLQFTLHIRFSSSPSTGLIEWYGNPDGAGMRRLWPSTAAPFYGYTMITSSSGSTVPSHSRIGIYRNKMISGTAHDYWAGYTVATTRSAAEASAF